jgi:hypothetical protein
MSSNKPLPTVDGQGIIDMHIHVGPELLRRRYSPATLAEEARREGIGVVMKNHFQPTTGWAAMLRAEDDSVPLIGSVVLNDACGGIDIHGIRAALSGWKRDVTGTDPDPDRFMVWMPTLCAEAHLHIMGRRDIPLEWGVKEQYSRHYPLGEGLNILDGEGNRIPGLERVFTMIRDQDLVLASGHLGKAETKLFAKWAHEAGLRRLVLTHPLFQATELEPDEIKDLWTRYGTYCELAFVNMAMDNLSPSSYADVIRAVGAEGCILSSDVGQTFSATVGDAFREYFDILRGEGISEDDIVRMSIINPRRLLL